MCVCVRGFGWVGGEGGCCGERGDCRKMFCLLQKPCAAATDRRRWVSSDSVWTDIDGYGRRSKRDGERKTIQWFLCASWNEGGWRARMEEDECCQLKPYISPPSLSLWLMESESPPHSSAWLTTTCVAWRGRELIVINLTTSLTAH